MEIWENDDYETPVEQYPGYLGVAWEGTLLAGTELQPLTSLDLRRYSELVDERGGERQLNIDLPSSKLTILFRAYDSIADILDQLPSVRVYLDNGPPDGGPASGGTHVFFLAEQVTETDLEASIAALVTALKSDFACLEKLGQQQRT
jgi:hypothetical protein